MPSQAELLHWATKNSINEATKSEDPTVTKEMEKLDPKWIDIILGKEDSISMKESMESAVDESLPIDVRVSSLDNFEMFVENLDNANDLKILGLWKPLLNLLQSETVKIRMMAAWIIGTCVQNNAKAQNDLVEMNGLETLIIHLKSEKEISVQIKLLRSISSLITSNATCFKLFYSSKGFELISTFLQKIDSEFFLDDSTEDITTVVRNFKKKLIYMLNFLLSTEESKLNVVTALACQKENLFEVVLNLFGRSKYDDVEFVEWGLKFISHMLNLEKNNKLDSVAESRVQLKLNSVLSEVQEKFKDDAVIVDLILKINSDRL
ncbi:hsp70 nucleotide exchange factor fes1 [Clydaea vesicula]|uniref:Hsp70 nucleotide exchange factor fes1 n=1 Tax=Clydaea vesicula TaxID=447962 RepID=A0AAD5XXC9_9FUNG|nr:hsp70 nucleotide exchange factor fes1 [Clydaea vesicula]